MFSAVEQPFGRYTLLKQLGAGAASNVFLARDGDDPTVALKILHRELISRPDHMTRFRNEAEWMSSINDPNVIAILDVGEIEGCPYIATEYTEGETLRDYIPLQMSVEQILYVGMGVASG